MAYMTGDWTDWLRLLNQGISAAGGIAGAGGLSGVGLPDAGAAVPAAVTPPPVAAPPPVAGGAMMPDAGALMPSSGSPTPWLPNGVPSAARPPPRPAVGPARTAGPAQLNTDDIMPGPDTFRDRTPFTAPYLNTDDIMPGPNTEGFRRSWWQRNISDPMDKAFTADPKTGLSPGMKALSGMGSTAGKLGAVGGNTPAFPSSAAGGGAYKPAGAINAAQMAQARAQARQLLQQQATLNAPWLKIRLGQGGLMG